jgi:hypothetical protein
MTDRELMQMALEALESECDATKFGAAEAIRSRLAQPEPKREWQWLTEDEIDKILDSAGSKLSAILLVEAQLRGKNI